MAGRLSWILLLVVSAVGTNTWADQAGAPAGNVVPVLSVEAGGPTASVTSLAFSPDGTTLYAAGYDKIVRTWKLDKERKKFVLQDQAFRVPIGPGTTGVINVLALSPDGEWLAASGLGMARNVEGFQKPGRIYPIAGVWTPEMYEDQATIYLFHTKSAAVRLLRGHRGRVLTTVFAPDAEKKSLILVSAAAEPDGENGSSRYRGRVCVWDVGQAVAAKDSIAGVKLAEWTYPKPFRDAPLPPGLAVHHAGNGPKDLRVAMAWRDGRLRVWDVAQGTAAIREERDGDEKWNNTAAYVAGGRLITSGATAEGKQLVGRLQWWDDRPEGPRKLAPLARLSPPGGAALLWPCGFALLSAKGDGKADYAACVCLLGKTNGERLDFDYTLLVVNLANGGIVSHVLLWSGKPGERATEPIIAASPRGQHLAVAGDGPQRILVYALSDLLQDKNERQALDSLGVTARSVSFAQQAGNADSLGLLLREQPDNATRQSDVVFDFAKRELVANAAGQGWKTFGPNRDEWRVSAERLPRPNQNRWRFSWSSPTAQQNVDVDLGPREEITAYTVVPPWKAASAEPLLALATWDDDLGEPTLALYLARTGRLVRLLKGHVQRVRGLAASPDGKLLASTGEDQIVCVWSLKDTDAIIGQHATISGLTLEKHGNDLIVRAVQDGKPIAESLKQGDVIDGLAFRENDARKPPVSAWAFYDAVWQAKPGGAAWLKVRRGERETQVNVQVEQAADDRKPLLSLLVLRTVGRPAKEWIAWTPAGVYDSSGADAERYVGWQFNPARLGEPVRYARLEAYRDRYYQPKLLKPLVDTGSLDEALDALKKPIPKPRVQIDALVEPQLRRTTQVEAPGPYVVRSPQVDVRFTVTGPSLRNDEVKVVRLEVDGKRQESTIESISDQSSSLTLTFPGERGEHRVRIVVENTDGQAGAAELHVVHQPPPPVIEFAGGQNSRTVREKTFTLAANVRAGSAGQTVRSWLHVDAGKERALPSGTINEVLELQPGPNVLRLRAANEGALPDFEKNETAEQSLVVVFEPSAAPAPRLTQIALPGGRRVDVLPGKPVIVDAAQIQLLGKITSAEEDLAGVALKATAGALVKFDGAARMAVAAGKREFELNAENSPKITLEPGKPVEILLEATTLNGKEPGKSPPVRIEYQPGLPELELTSPRLDEERKQGKPDEAPPSIKVAGLLKESTPFHPFELLMEVRDKDGKPIVQAGGQSVLSVARRSSPTAGEPVEFGNVQLGNGANRVRVWMKNRWRESAPTERSVSYLRPPLVTMRTFLPNKEKPFATVEADAWSPPDLPLTKIVLNNREYPLASVAKRDAQNPTVWHIALKDVALTRGANRLLLKAANHDGYGEKVASVQAPLTDADKAQIDVASKTESAKAAYRLMLHIQSPSRLKSVEVFHERRSVYQEFDPALKPDEQGLFHWEKELDLRLRPQANALHVEAVNDAGLQEKQITVSYTPTPVQLMMEPLPKAPVTAAEVECRGRVVWNEPDQEKEVEAKLPRLAAFVNGFRQRPPTLEPKARGQERAFSFKLVLNQDRNHVRIESPDLPLQPGGQSDFIVTCTRPEKPKLLVFVVQIATDAEKISARELQERAFHSLQVSQLSTARGVPKSAPLKSAVFDEVRLLSNLGDDPYIVKDTVERKLAAIKRQLASPSDVLLIYWVGKEKIADGEDFLLTHDNLANPRAQDWKKDAVPLQSLLDVDQTTPGARVVMLDVASDKVDKKPLQLAWSTIQAAVLRYAWSKEKTPALGLLQVLEDVALNNKPVSLEDVATAAGEHRPKIRDDVPEFMRHLWYLADLVIVQKE